MKEAKGVRNAAKTEFQFGRDSDAGSRLSQVVATRDKTSKSDCRNSGGGGGADCEDKDEGERTKPMD